MGRRVTPKAGSRAPSSTFEDIPRPPLPMPHPGKGRAWHRHSREAWRAATSRGWCEWAEDPSQYALGVRWLALVDQFWTQMDAGASPSAVGRLSAEIRALEYALAMTPAARQALRLSPAPSRRRSGSTARTSGLSAADLLGEAS